MWHCSKAGIRMSDLDACMYCPGEQPRNRKLAKRLRDTRQNRNREESLWRALAVGMTISPIRRR